MQVAHPSCNVIPAAEQPFASTLGEVSSPFAGPGDVLTVRRESAVFSQSPSANQVTVRFTPAGGPQTVISNAVVLPPEDGTDCPLIACTAGHCPCVRVVFPDTDAEVGTPADGVGLAGPADITVVTDGATTATIDSLYRPATNVADTLVVGFVALPARTEFGDLANGAPAPILAAPDRAGNVFVPLSFAGLVGDGSTLTSFLEAVIPGLATIGDIRIDSLTTKGAILPPLIRRPGTDALIATADAPRSVLRVVDGQALLGLNQIEGRGPLVLPGVQAIADPRKRADPFTMRLGRRFAVFENRECGLLDPPSTCRDLNGDGDQRDYFLQTLDLEAPQSPPLIIDVAQGEDFGGYPATFPPAYLYAFSASDALVEFRIPEPAVPIPYDLDTDVDGDGTLGEVVRSGAYDLVRGNRIPQADGSQRRSLRDGLLAFSTPLLPPNAPDVLAVYDANSPDPYLGVLVDGSGTPFPVTRDGLQSDSLGRQFFLPFDVDVAASGSLVAGVIDEVAMGHDVNADGLVADTLTVLQIQNGQLQDQTLLATPMFQTPLGRDMSSSSRLLATEFVAGFPNAMRTAITVYERDHLHQPVQVCDAGPGTLAGLAGPISDEIVPCYHPSDGHLRVYLPNAPEGATELDLGLTFLSDTISWETGGGIPLANGSRLIFGVDEVTENRDLDGDGFVGTPGSPGTPRSILHVFNARTRRVSNLREVALVGWPLMGFVDRGMYFHKLLSLDPPVATRVFLRDLDEDEVFEEFRFDPLTGQSVLDDNCPDTSNPDQADGDGDGVGDACDDRDTYVEYKVSPSSIEGNVLPDEWNLTLDDVVLSNSALDDPENHRVRRAAGLLLPARSNGSNVEAPERSYVRYDLSGAAQGIGMAAEGKIPPPSRHVRRRWELVNEFGSLVVQSSKVSSLLVPTAFSATAAPTGPPPADHFICYKTSLGPEPSEQAPDPGNGRPRLRVDLQGDQRDAFDDCAADQTFADTNVGGHCQNDLRKVVEVCSPAATSAVDPPRATSATFDESVPRSDRALVCYSGKRSSIMKDHRAALRTGRAVGSRLSQSKHIKRDLRSGTAAFTTPGSSFPAPTRLDTKGLARICVPSRIVAVADL